REPPRRARPREEARHQARQGRPHHPRLPDAHRDQRRRGPRVHEDEAHPENEEHSHEGVPMAETVAAPAPAQKKSPIVPIVIAVLVIAVLVVLFKVLPVGAWLKSFQTWV